MRAIHSGKLERKPCVICSEEKVHAHHEDYTKPFEVVWLCQKHHRALHDKKLTEEEKMLIERTEIKTTT